MAICRQQAEPLDVAGTDYDMSGDKGVVAPIGIGSS